MSQLDPLKSFTQTKYGQRVDRATANLTNALPLFSVLAGRVSVTKIVGEVTTIMETKTINLKLQANPTTGTTNDMCANLDMTAAEQGTLLTISGTAADALRAGKSGAVVGQAAPVEVAIGAIEAVVGATHTGSIKWSLWYVPLDDGAYVEAA
jgi:ethanolamine ammonia-lyase large subunit